MYIQHAAAASADAELTGEIFIQNNNNTILFAKSLHRTLR